MMFGSNKSLRIFLEWRDSYGTEYSVGKTWGDLQLWVGETLVWGEIDSAGVPQGIQWSWIDILEFISNAWVYLNEEEQYPAIFDGKIEPSDHFGRIKTRIETRWDAIAEEQADAEDSALRDFLAVHDFSDALQGACPPQLVFLRQGALMLVSTVSQQWELSFSEVMSTLQQLGDCIHLQLEQLPDARSTKARKNWENREEISHLKRIQIATGRTENSLKEFWPTSLESSASNDGQYQLKAAARMLDKVASDVNLKQILLLIYQAKLGAENAELGRIQSLALNLLVEVKDQYPSDQGYALAALLRVSLGNKSNKIDLYSILKGWGVNVALFTDAETPIDAIAIWGGNRQSAILLNEEGPRSKHPSGKLSTLAHEICHLLVDKHGALPAIEVLGGRVAKNVEQRANAFAAEFLIPRNVVIAAVSRELNYVHQAGQREKAISNLLVNLAAEYGASHELIAWQILNSCDLSESDSAYKELIGRTQKSTPLVDRRIRR